MTKFYNNFLGENKLNQGDDYIPNREPSNFREIYESLILSEQVRYPCKFVNDPTFEIGSLYPKPSTPYCFYPNFKIGNVTRICDVENLTVTLEFDKDDIGWAFIIFNDICETFEPDSGGLPNVLINSQNKSRTLFADLRERFTIFEAALKNFSNVIIFDCELKFQENTEIQKKRHLLLDNSCFLYNENFAAFEYIFKDAYGVPISHPLHHEFPDYDLNNSPKLTLGQETGQRLQREKNDFALILLQHQYSYSLRVLPKLTSLTDSYLFNAVHFRIADEEHRLRFHRKENDTDASSAYLKLKRVQREGFDIVLEHEKKLLKS